MIRITTALLTVLVLLALALFGGYRWGHDKGVAAVQAQWDKQKAVDLAESTRLTLEASATALQKFRNSERNTDEQTRLDTGRAQRTVALAAQSSRVRPALEAFRQRDLSTTPGTASAAAFAGEATTARELFGSCTERYSALAQQAEQLRDQVTGLLADALNVCRSAPAPPLFTTPPFKTQKD